QPRNSRSQNTCELRVIASSVCSCNFALSNRDSAKLSAHGSMSDDVWCFGAIANGVNVSHVCFHSCIGLYSACLTQLYARVNCKFSVCSHAKSTNEQVSLDFFSTSHDCGNFV